MKSELGKISAANFENIIFKHCGFRRKEVSAGPQFGVDVSVVDLPNGMALAATSDPLSLIPALGLRESAWLSVHLMANDMATTGFGPMYGQFVLNLPSTFSMDDFRHYWEFIDAYCKEAGIAITGGHTGFIEGQQSTIAGGGTFFTLAPRDQMLVSSNARAGDSILVTKQCAISTTAILSMCFPQTVSRRLGKEILEEGRNMFYKTSSLQDALLAVSENREDITAMHDVTEGGVLGAIYELTVASGNGALVYDELPVGEVQQQVCDLFSLDPRFCIGAGAMIITCRRGKEKGIIERLQKNHIDCAVVGELLNQEDGIKMVEDDQLKDMPYHQEDPYWAAFFKAMKMGWK